MLSLTEVAIMAACSLSPAHGPLAQRLLQLATVLLPFVFAHSNPD
jgi:hypothetical protein